MEAYHDKEDGDFDFELDRADAISDRIIGRLDRLQAEGYGVPDILDAAAKIQEKLFREMVTPDLSMQCEVDLLKGLEADEMGESLGDLAHGLSLALADFTSQLRSEVEEVEEDDD